MARTPLITKFSMPSPLNVTNGKQMGQFSVELSAQVAWVQPHVQVTFRYVPFSFEIGSDDSFHDSTPNYASSSFEFHGGYPAGTYYIDQLYVWDEEAGISASYGESELMAMNLSYFFGIADRWAPAAPSISVASTRGLVDGNRAHVYGTAEPGARVTVYYKDGGGNYGKIDSVTADGAGQWSATSGDLADGYYSDVVAFAVDQSGYQSTYSPSTQFYVQQAPLAPIVHVANLHGGSVDTDRPLLWGTTNPNATVALYDGATQLGVWQADAYGWWMTQLPPLEAGQHQLSARVTDAFGRVAPGGEPLSVQVGPATGGIHFKIDSISTPESVGVNEGMLQALLDAVSTLFSGALDGAQTVNLRVTVAEMDQDTIASAAAALAPGQDGMPKITDARLQLSLAFAEKLGGPDGYSAYTISVLAHEMLHVLGFNDSEAVFANQLQHVGKSTYFIGEYATAINGGKVLLAADGSHVADSADLISPYYNRAHPYFIAANAHSSFSALDLAMLKDLGYQNTDTIVSADGHTYLPGSEKTINGIAGVDTVVINEKAAAYSIKADGGGYVLSTAGSSQLLNDIERLQFADADVALDVGAGQTGGVVYRMYQAAFDRTPDSAGLGYWLGQVDHGFSLLSLAREFKNSAEFIQRYGGDLSDEAYLGQLYRNVLHRAPDQAGLDYWQGVLRDGAARETVLLNFSESAENVAQLTGVLHDGFSYTPYIA